MHRSLGLTRTTLVWTSFLFLCFPSPFFAPIFFSTLGSSSRVSLGNKSVSSANLTSANPKAVLGEKKAESAAEEHKYFTGEFDMEYDMFSFSTRLLMCFFFCLFLSPVVAAAAAVVVFVMEFWMFSF
jgi:hypothetical protein